MLAMDMEIQSGLSPDVDRSLVFPLWVRHEPSLSMCSDISLPVSYLLRVTFSSLLLSPISTRFHTSALALSTSWL